MTFKPAPSPGSRRLAPMSTSAAPAPRPRLLRDTAAALVIAGLIAGSLFWGDDAWPLAPMRMFAKGTKKVVWALALEADFADGRTRRRIAFERFHLRRAEAEGQVTRVTRHPELLGDLIKEYNARTHDSGGKIVRLWLLSRFAPVRDGGVVRADSGRTRRGAGPPPGVVWVVRVAAVWPPLTGAVTG